MTITFLDRLKNNKNNLSKSLGFPCKTKIPLTLLNRIINAKVGETVNNPNKRGKRNIKITILIKNNARDAIKYYKILNKINKMFKNGKARNKSK